MRSKKCRGGKDRVKEASRRLSAILRNSRKLCVDTGDLAGLPAVSHLKTSCRGNQEPSNWMFLGVLAVGLLVSAVILVLACRGLSGTFYCEKNSTAKEIEIRTMRLDRLTLEGSHQDQEESTLFNDSEESEESQLWQPSLSNLRMHRER